MSPRRSGRGSPRRRWRRGSTARCATSTGRSRATPSLALVTVARREGRARAGPPRLRARPRRGGAEAVPGHADHLRPGDRRRFLLRLRAGAPSAARSPTRTCRAIEAEMRQIIAADEPLIREVWTREDVRAFFEQQGESFKAEWVMELPEGEAITMYRSGHGEDGWIDLCRGPHLASTGKLDPAGVQADARVGRLLARRPEEPDAEPHLRHRLAQQEAARRASRPARGSGQARPPQDRPGDGPVPPPGRSARQRLLAPQGLHHLARSSRPICAAGSTPPAIARSRPRS